MANMHLLYFIDNFNYNVIHSKKKQWVQQIQSMMNLFDW